MESANKKKSQVDKFREAARELETDQSEAAFDDIVKRIAEAKHAPYDAIVTGADEEAKARSAKKR